MNTMLDHPPILKQKQRNIWLQVSSVTRFRCPTLTQVGNASSSHQILSHHSQMVLILVKILVGWALDRFVGPRSGLQRMLHCISALLPCPVQREREVAVRESLVVRTPNCCWEVF